MSGETGGSTEYWPGEVSLCREGGDLSWWLVLELVAVAVDCLGSRLGGAAEGLWRITVGKLSNVVGWPDKLGD